MDDAMVDMRGTSRRYREHIQSIRLGLYILIIVGALCLSFVYTLRRDGIFACQAHGYSADRYLAECSAPAYGDYEHGAFWFGLEPAALQAAGRAKVLFLADSRVQLAFSTAVTADWFSLSSIKYYLLGFGYQENVVFVQELLRKLEPQAKVYIINVDSFFERTQTPPAKDVMRDPMAAIRYKVKRMWQAAHRQVCSGAPKICGHNTVVYRSRETGAYDVSGGQSTAEPVAYDQQINLTAVTRNSASAIDFIPRLGVGRDCIILTSIPHGKTIIDPGGTKLATTKAIAANLGMNLVAPELHDLQTFDGSHLDYASAQRWAGAFLAVAGRQIRRCLDTP